MSGPLLLRPPELYSEQSDTSAGPSRWEVPSTLGLRFSTLHGKGEVYWACAETNGRDCQEEQRAPWQDSGGEAKLSGTKEASQVLAEECRVGQMDHWKLLNKSAICLFLTLRELPVSVYTYLSLALWTPSLHLKVLSEDLSYLLTYFMYERSFFVAKVGLELTMKSRLVFNLRNPPPKCWDYSHEWHLWLHYLCNRLTSS